MSSTEAGAGDVGGDPPKQPSKRSKGKETRITKDSASVEDCLALLEDILSKGVKRGETTYLAAIREVSGEDLEEEDHPAELSRTSEAYALLLVEENKLENTIPPIIVPLIHEFKDVIPEEIPPGLPPMREIQHCIDLVLALLSPIRQHIE
uniref:Uncharacterized protein n=1 Tax=Ananas comosus var. bracteatus TaxID=296719 RepID=A0A6V7NPW0_ANACO|nr:unnamed protein product [Ananas comosus var. bracteatus]